MRGREKMSVLNKEVFTTSILVKDFNGSIPACASKLGISRGYLHYFLTNDHCKPGSKIISAVYNYCTENNKDIPGLFFPILTKKDKGKSIDDIVI